MNFFSVIIPVYNKSNLLQRSINSVLNQTYKNFEIVIVNDGSEDNSLEIAQSIKDDRIKIINQINQGVSVARNTGIKNSTCGLITFLDPDDYWLENHLAILNDIYEKCEHIDAIYSTGFSIKLLDGSFVNASKEVEKYLLKGKMYAVVEDMFSIYNKSPYGFVHTNSIMIPKRIFSECGLFASGCKIGEDIDMWFRIMMKYPTIIIKNITTVYCRDESTATSTQKRNYQWPFFDIADKAIESGEVNSKIEQSLINFIDEYRISTAKHMAMDGEKKLSKDMINRVRYKHKYIKDMLVYYIVKAVPSKVVQEIYYQKHKKIFRKE